MVEKSPLTRNSPQQERSQKRMELILDAAAAVFTEVGYSAATTNEIARRANTSIGSLYRFFPDKLSLFEALSVRYDEQIRQTVLLQIAKPEVLKLSVETVVRLFLDTFEQFLTANPAFEAVFVWADAVPETKEIDKREKNRAAQNAADLFAIKLRDLPPERRFLIARTCLQLTNSYLRMRLTYSEIPRALLRDEYERVLSGYLRAYWE